MSDTLYYLPRDLKQESRAMVFVDGENLAIRYRHLLGNKAPEQHVEHERDVYVWTPFANIRHHVACEVVRRYYYTAVQGDTPRVEVIEDKLKALGIEAPRVFKKERGSHSKRVDISLAVDMLTHAHRANFDIAILVAGDEDYVPLVDAIAAEGRRLVVWFFKDGLSPALRRRADHYFDLSTFFFKDSTWLQRHYT